MHSQLGFLWDKQDKGTLFLFFLFGMLSIPLSMATQVFFLPLYFLVPNNLWDDPFFSNLFFVGPNEELAKFLAFLLIAHPLKTLKEPQDGVIQGAMVGLAFGFIENMMYFEMYESTSLFIRPLLTSTGHAVLGGIWGGAYSSATYSNLFSHDRGSWGRLYLGLFTASFLHGLYNAFLYVHFTASLFVDFVAYVLAITLFKQLVTLSPYRGFPLSQARKAVPHIRRGLYFNPKSFILNRNVGIYLMYLNKYQQAAHHFDIARRWAYDPRRVGFFSAVCSITFRTDYHGSKQLRIAWARLTDNQRKTYMEQLALFLEHDPELLARIQTYISTMFQINKYKSPEQIAIELKTKRSQKKYAQVNPVLQEVIRTLTHQERRHLATKIQQANRKNT